MLSGTIATGGGLLRCLKPKSFLCSMSHSVAKYID